MAFTRVINLCGWFRRASSFGLLTWLYTTMILGWTALPANTQQADSTPEVVVVVLSGAFPTDVVSITYSGKVDESVIRAELEALQRFAGWQAADIKVTSADQQNMTSVEFSAAGIVDWKNGVLQVEPFIVALKNHSSLRINYLMQGTFPFRSLRDFGNRYVDIKWKGTETAADYSVRIKNNNFEKLNLPLVVEPKTEENGSGSGKTGGKNIWLALVVAVMAGAIVFTIVNRITRK